MPYRIEVLAHEEDGRGKQIEKALSSLGKKAKVRIVDVYTSENGKLKDDRFTGAVCNPVTQSIMLSPRKRGSSEKADEGPRLHGDDTCGVDFDWALEIGYLPGVTDNIGHTAAELLELAGADNDNECYSSRLLLIKSDASKEDIEKLASELSNKLIQRASIKSAAEFKKDGGMDVIIPKVLLDNKGAVADDVDL